MFLFSSCPIATLIVEYVLIWPVKIAAWVAMGSNAVKYLNISPCIVLLTDGFAKSLFLNLTLSYPCFLIPLSLSPYLWLALLICCVSLGEEGVHTEELDNELGRYFSSHCLCYGMLCKLCMHALSPTCLTPGSLIELCTLSFFFFFVCFFFLFILVALQMNKDNMPF